MLARLKSWAATLKREALVLWFASRDPRSPWYAKWLAIFIVAYALSPIDLIPDFIPVVGYLDELILLPGAIWLTLKLMPREVLLDSRARAQAWMEAHRPRPRNWIAGILIVVLWILLLWGIWAWLIRPRFGTH
ncbi:MAG TPA: YkvA family protein [Burkholderiales bacterium]|nr:YkvA family protein [Burkholderiales bacterium]